jgi:hypothetical protein
VFKVGDYVYLKVSPMKGVNRFGVKGKLAPRYIGPFRIIQQCGPVAYRLQLPEHMSAVHNVFHVSQLKKCLRVPEQVMDVSEVNLEPDLTYSEYPIRVLDQKDRITQRRTIKFYKVQWNKHSEDEATWESEKTFLWRIFQIFLLRFKNLQYCNIIASQQVQLGTSSGWCVKKFEVVVNTIFLFSS